MAHTNWRTKQNPIVATYYANNFHYDFIDRVWRDNPLLETIQKMKIGIYWLHN